MKYFIFIITTVLVLSSCRDKSPLDVEVFIEMSKQTYLIEEPISFNYNLNANKTVYFAEGKLLDENDVTVSDVSTHNFEGQEVSGEMNLTIWDQTLPDGIYTLQFTVGDGIEVHREYVDVQIDGAEKELTALMVSEATLGDSYIYMATPANDLTPYRVEQYAMDLLGVNSANQYMIYAMNNNQELKSYSTSNGSLYDTEQNGVNPPGGYYLDACKSEYNIYVATDQGEVLTFASNGIKSQERNFSDTHRFKQIENSNEYFIIYEEALSGTGKQVSVYRIDNGLREQVYSMTDEMTSSFSDGERYAWFVGNNKLFQFDAQSFSFEELSVGTDIDEVIGVRNDNLIITTPTGYLVYDTSVSSYSAFTLAYHNLFYEPLNDYLVKANGGTLTVESFIDGTIYQTYNYNGTINGIKFLYNF